jgi:hypothetical protein
VENLETEVKNPALEMRNGPAEKKLILKKSDRKITRSGTFSAVVV